MCLIRNSVKKLKNTKNKNFSDVLKPKGKTLPNMGTQLQKFEKVYFIYLFLTNGFISNWSPFKKNLQNIT
jgi:hypothetical protein